MTVRHEFDEYCLGQTLKTGAEFRLVKTIFGVAQSMSNVSLSTSEGVFNGSFLVGADGANSQIRRICAFPVPRVRGFALEACLELPKCLPVMRLDFGVVRSGYGWIFPKNDHVNVGLYTCSHNGSFGRCELQQYARENIGSASINRVVGQYIGCDTHETMPAKGRVLLVGDAGGFTDALTGEGIYQAITTGQAAARTILQHFTDSDAIERGYSAELFPLRADLLLRRQVARLLYSHFDYAKAALSLSCVRKAFSRIYASSGGFITSMSRALGSLSIVPSLREIR
jgi:flavin-dependent dehydrogenase